MKKLIALLLALAVSAAYAAPANMCGTTGPGIALTDMLDSMENRYTCVPYPGQGIGNFSSTSATVRSNPGGVVAWWYCRSGVAPAYKWSLSMAAVTNAQMLPDRTTYLRTLAVDLAGVIGEPNTLAAFNAVACKRINTTMAVDDLSAAWCPSRLEMFSQWKRLPKK